MNPMCLFSHSISVKRSTRCDTRLWLVNSPGSIFQMKSIQLHHLLSQRPLSCDAVCGAGIKNRLHQCHGSVVQGSGFGPSSFDIVASDLHPLHQQNSLAKYADDTYLIVPPSARTTVRDELDHISVWAATNNLRLNASKSRELILHRRRGLVPPASIPDVERVSTMKVLGVTLRDDLNASTHITGVLGACS